MSGNAFVLEINLRKKNWRRLVMRCMHSVFFWPFLNLIQNENFRWQLEQMFAEQMSFLILPDQRYQSTEGRFSSVYCSYHNMTLMVLLTFIIMGCLFCRLVVNMCHWSISWWMPHMIYQTKLIQSRYVHNTWDFLFFSYKTISILVRNQRRTILY